LREEVLTEQFINYLRTFVLDDETHARLGALVEKTDAYDPMPSDTVSSDLVGTRGDNFQSVWTDAENMRESGVLLGLAKDIKCPVLAIHGDHDPHPVDGVKIPLSSILPEFRCILLEKCGHTPWRERHARDRFFSILKEEIAPV
jgi:pimeloyl-ACP methyl ester carboxylesterase